MPLMKTSSASLTDRVRGCRALAASPLNNRPLEDDPAALIAAAVYACKIAGAFRRNLRDRLEAWLRAIREAGRLLDRIERSRGGRPPKNSSGGLTAYQIALRAAGIT